MALQKYEILSAGKWYPVRGTTSGVKVGWLHWQDKDGCTGLSPAGKWRLATKRTTTSKTHTTA